MQAGTDRPYEYGPEVTLAGTQLIYELAAEQTCHSIEDAEKTGNGTVLAVSPVKIGCYEIFPRK